MTVSAKINLAITAAESLTSPSDLVGDSGAISLAHAMSDKQTINATSTVPATKAYSDTLTLTAGAVSLDLAALTDAINADLNLTGLKVQALGIKCPTTNTAPVAVAAHATNGYALLAASDGKVEVQIGGSLFMTFNDDAPDVGASAKVLEFTSSDTDATVQVLIVAG